MKNKAFVLIELLFVLFVIGILSAIAIPAYSDYLAKSQVAESFLLSLPIKKVVTDYYAYHGSFPTDNLAAGLTTPEKLSGHYVNKIEIESGKVLVTFGPRSLAEIRDKIAYFVPTINSETIKWHCEEKDDLTIAPKYLGNCIKN